MMVRRGEHVPPAPWGERRSRSGQFHGDGEHAPHRRQRKLGGHRDV